MMYFLHSDPKAQTGKGWHLGAHCETPEEPSKDSELWVITLLVKYSPDLRWFMNALNSALWTTLCTVSCFSTKHAFPLFSGTTPASEFSDYQSGFRSCLANFNQYLLMADNLNGSDHWMLSQLSSKLCCSRGRDNSSTMDSGPGRAETHDPARRPPPSAAVPDEGKAAKSKPVKPQSASVCRFLPIEDALQSCGTKQAVHTAETTQNTHEKRSSLKKFDTTDYCRNEVSNTQNNVWRPW